MVIYKATNKINGKIYIGQTVRSLSGRIAGHIRDSKLPFGCALRKYGIQSFDISIIDSAEDVQSLNEKEKYWIKSYGSKSPAGYNLTDGGEGNCGWNPSKETRAKLSAAHTPERKKIASERFKGDQNPTKSREVVAKIRAANIGRKHSIETRKNMSLAGKGKPKTEEWKKKVSEALQGHVISIETKKKISETRMGSKDSIETIEKKRLGSIGHKISDEAKLRMSQARKGVPRSEEAKAKMRKPKSEEGRAAIAESNRSRHKKLAVANN